MNSTDFGPGWNISPRGFTIISQNDTIKDEKTLLQNALNADLKEIGASVLSKELNKSRISKLVLQIQKIRNVSAPKANEDSSAAPRMLKLILTDGESYAQAIETSTISTISRERTPPGSKILLSNAQVLNGFLILKPDNTKLLGGKVAHLYEKWELAKSVQHCSRPTAAADGPPAWVNFGNKIAAPEDDFRISDSKTKDQAKENSEFENLRQGAIAEASTGAVKKVFGGGVKQPLMINNKNDNRTRQDGGKGYNKNKKDSKFSRDKDVDSIPQKPSDKVSLFDFLEDKLNITETSVNNIKQKQGNTETYNSNSVKPTIIHKKSFHSDDFYSNQKNQNRSYNNYNETKYNAQKEPSGVSGNPKFTRETNKVQDYYNTNKYVPKETSYKNLATNRTGPQSQNQEYYTNKRDFSKKNENYYSNHRYHNPIELDDTRTPRANIKQDNYTSDRRTLDQNDRNAIKENRDINLLIKNKKEETDSWHYRAPEKTQNNNSSMDHLAESISKVSMNSEFASRSLRQHLNLDMKKLNTQPVQNITPINQDLEFKNWCIGDECLAKYWEDEKFYPAKITASTETTYVVQFKGYGNVEEVLKLDCMPLRGQTRGDDRRQYKSGTLEFRRNPRKFAYS